jgi:hypothetical protein
MLEFPTSGLGWIINQGPFAVGVEYIGQVSAPVSDFSGHLTTDADGCQPGKNLVHDADVGQWLDACALGISGDFVIRVTFTPTGSGCFGDSDCDGDVDLLDYATLQRCFSGTGKPVSQECLLFDCDADTDVDFDDATSLGFCLLGPELPCSPVCAACQVGARAAAFAGAGALAIAGDSAHAGTAREFTVRQILAVVGIVSLLSVLFIGPCISATCRAGTQFTFNIQGAPLTGAEQLRFGQALSWLQARANEGDTDSLNAYTWYETHGGTSPIFGPLRVNHFPRDPAQGGPNIIASTITSSGVVTVHQDFVTGNCFLPEFLALVLFAEWQHIDSPLASEQSLRPAFNAFRVRHNITAYPQFQHGAMEGEGVP